MELFSIRIQRTFQLVSTYTGFFDGESARLQVAQERGALPRHVLQPPSDGR